jgi:hypothetical protein
MFYEHDKKYNEAIKIHPWITQYKGYGLARSRDSYDPYYIEQLPTASTILLRMEGKLAKKNKNKPVLEWRGAMNFGEFESYKYICPDKEPSDYKNALSTNTTLHIFRLILRDVALSTVMKHEEYDEWVSTGTCFIRGYPKQAKLVIQFSLRRSCEKMPASYQSTRFCVTILFVDANEPSILLADVFFYLETDPYNLYRGETYFAKMNSVDTIEDILIELFYKKEKKACRIIEEAFLKAKYNPEFTMCRNMFVRDIKNITNEILCKC